MNQKKVVGVFHSQEEAISAIEGLKRQGYTSYEISVLAKDDEKVEVVSDETGTKAPEGFAGGMTAGGILGGTAGLLASAGLITIPGIGPILAAGPIAATLTGVAVGASAGGLLGGLIGLGIPEEEAKLYDTYIREGRILVLVDSNVDRDYFAYETFRGHNSLNASSYEDYIPEERRENRPLSRSDR